MDRFSLSIYRLVNIFLDDVISKRILSLAYYKYIYIYIYIDNQKIQLPKSTEQSDILSKKKKKRTIRHALIN